MKYRRNTSVTKCVVTISTRNLRSSSTFSIVQQSLTKIIVALRLPRLLKRALGFLNWNRIIEVFNVHHILLVKPSRIFSISGRTRTMGPMKASSKAIHPQMFWAEISFWLQWKFWVFFAEHCKCKSWLTLNWKRLALSFDKVGSALKMWICYFVFHSNAKVALVSTE